MLLAANVVIALVALLHLYFLVLEMFLWDKPAGLKAFGQTPEAAAASKVLAANQGTGLFPFVEGQGQLTEFYAPLSVSDLPSGCAAQPGVCEQSVQRAGLSFTAGGEALALFDHQTGQLGPHAVKVADVIHVLSGDTACDGGTDTRQDFLLVHD